MVKKLKDSTFFSIQVDENRDIANLAILPISARYVNVDKELQEYLLLCYTLTERTTGEEIFIVIYNYVKRKSI